MFSLEESERSNSRRSFALSAARARGVSASRSTSAHASQVSSPSAAAPTGVRQTLPHQSSPHHLSPHIPVTARSPNAGSAARARRSSTGVARTVHHDSASGLSTSGAEVDDASAAVLSDLDSSQVDDATADQSLLSDDDETALLRQMQTAHLAASVRSNAQPIRAPMHAFGHRSPSPHSTRGGPSTTSASASASLPLHAAQPFTLAEMDILSRLDSLRHGLESYRAHTTASLRTVSRQASSVKAEVLSSVSAHLAQLESKLDRAHGDHDGVAAREAATGAIDRLRAEVLATRKRDLSRTEALESRVALAEQTAEEAREAVAANAATQASKIAQVRSEVLASLASRLQHLAVAPQPATATGLDATASSSPFAATLSSPSQQQVSGDLAALKEQNAALLHRLESLEAHTRANERKMLEAEATRAKTATDAIDAVREQTTTRFERLNEGLRAKAAMRDRAARESLEDARKREAAIVANFEKQIEALRAEHDEREARHAEERAAAEVAQRSLEREAAATRAALNKLAKHQARTDEDRARLVAEQVREQLDENTRANSRKNATGGLSSSASAASAASLAQLQASLEVETRKRRDLHSKVQGYEAVQKQVLDDVVALTKQTAALRKEQTRAAKQAAAAIVTASTNGHAASAVSESILAQLQKDVATQHANVAAQHDALKDIYAELAALQDQVQNTKSAPVSDSTGRGGADPSAISTPPPSSADVVVSAHDQTQANLIRAQKKLIVRYRDVSNEVAELRKAKEEATTRFQTIGAELQTLKAIVVDSRSPIAAAVVAPVTPVAPTPTAKESALAADLQVLQGDVAGAASRFQDFLTKNASDRLAAQRAHDALAESLTDTEQRLREVLAAAATKTTHLDARTKESAAEAAHALAALESRVRDQTAEFAATLARHSTSLDARLASQASENAASTKALQAALTALQARQIDVGELASAQASIAALTASSKSATTGLAELRTALGSLESQHAALQVESNNQESFNYDLSGQLQKVGASLKALEARALFNEGKTNVHERALRDEKQHTEESLATLTASIASQGLALQKTQDRLVAVLDTINEVEHAAALQSSAAKKQELKMNSLEAQLQSAVETIADTVSNAASPKEAAQSTVPVATFNTVLTRLQALEAESDLPRSHALRLDSLDTSVSTLQKSSSASSIQVSGVDTRLASLAGEVSRLVQERMPEQRASLDHLTARLEELHRRALDHADERAESTARRTRAVEKTTEKVERDVATETKRVADLHSALVKDVEGLRGGLDTLTRVQAEQARQHQEAQAAAEELRAQQNAAPSLVVVTPPPAAPSSSVSTAGEALLHTMFDSLSVRLDTLEQGAAQTLSLGADLKQTHATQFDACVAQLDEQRARIDDLDATAKATAEETKHDAAAGRTQAQQAVDTVTELREQHERLADEMKVTASEVAALRTASQSHAEAVEALRARDATPEEAKEATVIAPHISESARDLLQAEVHQLATDVEHLRRQVDRASEESGLADEKQSQKVADVTDAVEALEARTIAATNKAEKRADQIDARVNAIEADTSNLRVELTTGLAALDSLSVAHLTQVDESKTLSAAQENHVAEMHSLDRKVASLEKKVGGLQTNALSLAAAQHKLLAPADPEGPSRAATPSLSQSPNAPRGRSSSPGPPHAVPPITDAIESQKRKQAEADAAAEAAEQERSKLEAEQAEAEAAVAAAAEAEQAAQAQRAREAELARKDEQLRLARAEADRQRLAAEAELERLKAEQRAEAERIEEERRAEAERLEAELVEAERVKNEQIEAERIEAERVKNERIEAERIEAERVKAERIEAERVEAERIENERIEAEKAKAAAAAAAATAATVAAAVAAKAAEEQREAAQRVETQRRIDAALIGGDTSSSESDSDSDEEDSPSLDRPTTKSKPIPAAVPVAATNGSDFSDSDDEVELISPPSLDIDTSLTEPTQSDNQVQPTAAAAPAKNDKPAPVEVAVVPVPVVQETKSASSEPTQRSPKHALLSSPSPATMAAPSLVQSSPPPAASPSSTSHDALSPLNKQGLEGAASASTQVRSNVAGTPSATLAGFSFPAASPSSAAANEATTSTGGILSTLAPDGLYSVHLALSARGLPRVGGGLISRKPNPLCILYERDGSATTARFEFVAKTEWQEGETEPIFFRHVEGRYRNHEPATQRMLLFRVYDVNEAQPASSPTGIEGTPSKSPSGASFAAGSYEVHESDRLGDVLVPLADLIRGVAGAGDGRGGRQTLAFPLRHSHPNQALRGGVTPTQAAKLNERIARATLHIEATVRPVDVSPTSSAGVVGTDSATAERAWTSVSSPRVASALSPSAVHPTLSRASSVSAISSTSGGGAGTSGLPSSPQRVASIAGLTDAEVAALVSGNEFLKYPSGSLGGLLSSPAESTVFLDLAEPSSGGVLAKIAQRSALYWCKPGQRTIDSTRCMPLGEMTGVTPGNTAKAFAKFVGKPPRSSGPYRAAPDTCFSIQGKSRTLELEARTSAQRDLWVKAIGLLVRDPNAVTFRTNDGLPSLDSPSSKSANSPQPPTSAWTTAGSADTRPTLEREHSLHANFDALFAESNPLDDADVAAGVIIEEGEEGDEKNEKEKEQVKLTPPPATPTPAPAPATPAPTTTAAPSPAPSSPAAASIFPPLSSPTARRMLVRASCRSLPVPGLTSTRVLALEEANGDFEFRACSVTDIVSSATAAPSFTRPIAFEVRSDEGQLVQFSLYDFPPESHLPRGLDLTNSTQLCNFLNGLDREDRATYRLGTVLAESDDLVAGAIETTTVGPNASTPTAPLVYEIQEHEDEEDDDAEEVTSVRPPKLIKTAHLVLSCTLLPPGATGEVTPRSSASPAAASASPAPASTSAPTILSPSAVRSPLSESPSPEPIGKEGGFEVRGFYSPNTSPTPPEAVSPLNGGGAFPKATAAPAAAPAAASSGPATPSALQTPMKSPSTSLIGESAMPHRSPVTGRLVRHPDGVALTPAQISRHDAFAVSASKAERVAASPAPVPTAVLARTRGIDRAQAFALYIRLRNLPPSVSGDVQAPIAALFTQCADGTFAYTSQTEWSSGPSPDFQTPLELRLDPDLSGDLLKINVYDCARAAVTDADRVGSVLVRFGDVIHAREHELAFALAHENQTQNARLAALNVLLILKCEPVDDTASASLTSPPRAADRGRAVHKDASIADERTAAGGTDVSFSLAGVGEDSLDLSQATSPASRNEAAKTPTSGLGAKKSTSPHPVATSTPTAAAVPSTPSVLATPGMPAAVVLAPGYPVGSGREVCISISCRDLPLTKVGSTTVDPIAAAFTQDPRTRHFIFVAQTEWVRNARNPDFDNLVTLDYHEGQGQIIKFSVYDVASASVRDHECIGSVLVRLDDIVGSEGEMMYQLLHEDPLKAEAIKGAVIILTHEAQESDEEQLHEDDVSVTSPTKPSVAAAATTSPTPAATGAASKTPARGTSFGGLLGSPGSSSDDDDDDSSLIIGTAHLAPPAQAQGDRQQKTPFDSDEDDSFAIGIGEPK